MVALSLGFACTLSTRRLVALPGILPALGLRTMRASERVVPKDTFNFQYSSAAILDASGYYLQVKRVPGRGLLATLRAACGARGKIRALA